jgi:uroporphyrinogen decarboxylase
MTPEIQKLLQDHFEKRFGTRDIMQVLGIDFGWVGPRRIGNQVQRHIAQQSHVPLTEGFYQNTHDLPLSYIKTLSDVEAYSPDRTPDWFDFSDIGDECYHLQSQGFVTVFGGAGIVDIVNGLGSRGRGYEQFLYDIMTEDELTIALIDKCVQMDYEYCRRGLESGRGCIDILYIGEDCGTQNGPLFPPEHFREFFAPRFKPFADLAHQYGAACMLHSCGSTRKLMPIFIEEIGLDILDAVQPEPAGMEPEGLKRDFGDQLTFCGMISLQQTLTYGTEEECRQEAERRIQVIGKNGGYIFSPPNTITMDTPLENILAIYEVATGKELK